MQMAAAPQPFSLFFKQQAPAVARLLRSSLRPDDVDDCLQETFMSALRSYDDFDGANPRAWILTIARRKAIDLHRSLARRPEAPAGASLETPAPAAPAPLLQG
jgi:DNA-directed RNA polymerase specialized sigma24 family protein